jgi:hypothetical protein
MNYNMKKFFMAVIALMMTISASAQFYIYCSDGNVIKVDSISMIAPSENVDPYNGHEYVDLGLSVKWATCNVGASSPEDYGDYFAWGETQPKSAYDWSTYKYCNGSLSSLTKYCTDSYYGTVDNKTQLELSDDAARANWGGSWRMPTDAELTELRNNCTWTWTTQNGVYGYKVTSKKSGYTNKSIFLPAAGYRSDSSLNNAGSSGSYWSSLLDSGRPYLAWHVGFNSGVYRDYYYRHYGFSVRPVYGEYIPASTLPTVTTSSATNISATSVTIGGNVTSDGGTNVTERGVVYSTSQNPTTANSKVTSGSGTGSFTYSLTNLLEGTTYYVRAYATNEKGTAYGNQVVFTTLEAPIENGHEYVDLGLSVKWATCNVGASKPEEYGDYFAWGETQPKSIYDWSTYKYCNGPSTSQTKYNNKSSFGTVDNKTTLELSDDAARANWGGSWRMPTDAEFTELREQCTWIWTTQNGVYGYKVTSKKSGYTNKSIFLPAAGYRIGSSLGRAGSYGDYWSSSLDTVFPDGAYGFEFLSGYVYRSAYDRFYGQSVRPVCQ